MLELPWLRAPILFGRIDLRTQLCGSMPRPTRVYNIPRASAASVSSDHKPRSAGEMRPSGATAVASMNNRPA